MKDPSGLRLEIVLLINGIANVLVAAMLLAFPPLGVGLPGLATPTNAEAFLAGGWGVAALALGVARVWAWRKSELRLPIAVVGLFEGLALFAFALAMLIAGKATVLQAILPLLIGLAFAALYVLALTVWREKPAVATPI